MRLLERLELHRHVVEMEELAVEGQAALAQSLDHELERLGINPLRLVWVLSVIDELARRGAAAEADLEPPAAHLIEHADFLDHAQRMIERQRVDQRAKAQPPGALRDRGQKHARARRHAERRRVVLGDVIGVETEPVIGFDDLQPRTIVVAERLVVAVEVIEDAELHPDYSSVTSIQTPPGSAIWNLPPACAARKALRASASLLPPSRMGAT